MPQSQTETVFFMLPEDIRGFWVELMSHGALNAAEPAIRSVFDAATAGMGRDNHQMQEHFAMLGPIAQCERIGRALARVLMIPFVSVLSSYIEETNDILVRISEVLETTRVTTRDGQEHSMELVLQPPGQGTHFILPPMIICVSDIAHLPDLALRDVLQSVYFKERILCTKAYLANASRVCWLLGSTEPMALERLGPKFKSVDLTGPHDPVIWPEDV